MVNEHASIANRLLARVYKLVNVLGLLWEDCQQCIPHLGSIAHEIYPGTTWEATSE